jgi:hypothetical protein
VAAGARARVNLTESTGWDWCVRTSLTLGIVRRAPEQFQPRSFDVKAKSIATTTIRRD